MPKVQINPNLAINLEGDEYYLAILIQQIMQAATQTKKLAGLEGKARYKAIWQWVLLIIHPDKITDKLWDGSNPQVKAIYKNKKNFAERLFKLFDSAKYSASMDLFMQQIDFVHPKLSQAELLQRGYGNPADARQSYRQQIMAAFMQLPQQTPNAEPIFDQAMHSAMDNFITVFITKITNYEDVLFTLDLIKTQGQHNFTNVITCNIARRLNIQKLQAQEIATACLDMLFAEFLSDKLVSDPSLDILKATQHCKERISVDLTMKLIVLMTHRAVMASGDVKAERVDYFRNLHMAYLQFITEIIVFPATHKLRYDSMFHKHLAMDPPFAYDFIRMQLVNPAGLYNQYYVMQSILNAGKPDAMPTFLRKNQRSLAKVEREIKASGTQRSTNKPKL